MPSSRARRIVARESASSCGPQPNAQPPPPIAQAPKPTVVILSPLLPSGPVGAESRLPSGSGNQQQFTGRLACLECAMRLGGLGEGELVLDPHLESAALDPRQHLPRSCNQLRARGDVVGEGRARQKER